LTATVLEEKRLVESEIKFHMNCKVWQIIHEETNLYQVLPMALYDLIILGQDIAEEE